jgi:L-ascorbate metabolism protein UlaG (beta-lactamase superfamily)
MKITKYAHSCLLIEDLDKVCIMDPGNYSWDSGLLNVEGLTRLDYIIITHEHQDHMHLPFIKALVAKFPKVKIITTEPAGAILKKEGISQVSNEPDHAVEIFIAPHETMEPLASVTAQNIGVHYDGRLTHPGDSHHFIKSEEILALPVTAPWGTLARAAELITILHPKYVVPIHDWHWNDAAREWAYVRLDEFCTKLGIKFIKTIDGKSFEL